MTVEKGVDQIEEAILVLKDLLVSQDGLNDYYKALKESREDFDFKLNALIDAQMKNESEIIEVKESIIALKEISRSQVKRIENLENKN